MLVRGGVRGTNDIVSIGRAPNIAAKLSEKRGAKSIFISDSVYGYLNDTVKTDSGGSNMWSNMGVTQFGSATVRFYGSSYWWKP